MSEIKVGDLVQVGSSFVNGVTVSGSGAEPQRDALGGRDGRCVMETIRGTVGRRGTEIALDNGYHTGSGEVGGRDGVRCEVDIDRGMVVARRYLDALGKPVPPWAAEAFAILSADGRRVGVNAWPEPFGKSDTDAIIHARFVGTWGCLRLRSTNCVLYVADASAIRAATFPTASDYAIAARRALAMEAERAQPAGERGIKYPDQPTLTINWQPPAFTDDAVGQFAAAVSGLSRAVDSFVAKATDAAKREFPPERLAAENMRGLATCLRCGGPAGFLGIRCERVGGCATAEERVAAMEPDADLVLPMTVRGETRWLLPAPDRRTPSPGYATRDLAIAAWREAMLARERGR